MCNIYFKLVYKFLKDINYKVNLLILDIEEIGKKFEREEDELGGDNSTEELPSEEPSEEPSI